MKLFEAYIHSNETLQVKCIPMGITNVDTNSPFVKEYLGVEEAESYLEAIKIFEEKAKRI